MIIKLGIKAKNIKEKDGLRVQKGLQTLDFDFDQLHIIIGFLGIKGCATDFYKENTLCIDASYENHRRILINSYCYHNAIIPTLTEPTFLDNNIALSSKSDGIICVYLCNSGNYWKKHWNTHLEHLLTLLKQCKRKVVFKLHPKENKNKREYIQSKEFTVVNKVKEGELFAAIVQGGSKCYDLALQGIPLFCFDTYSEPYLCNSIASKDSSLLFQENINIFPLIEKYPEFIRMVQRHTVHFDEIENGNVFRKIKDLIK